VSSTPARPQLSAQHTPARTFSPGQPLTVSLNTSGKVSGVDFFYRHVNQGERWKSAPMTQSGGAFKAAIPGDYTKSVYPLQYYFVLHQGSAVAYHPEFNADLSNQPYFDVWHRA
jgi:hypothetical protein